MLPSKCKRLRHYLILVLLASSNTLIAQNVQRWENWASDFFIYNSNAISSPTGRNIGLHLWEDKGFGMELHHRNSKWGTALFTREHQEAIWLGNYNQFQAGQNGFTPWMTLTNGNVGIGTEAPESMFHITGEGRFGTSGWFGRNNGGGVQKLTLRLGQVYGWDQPVAELLTGDDGGVSRLDWKGLHWGYKMRYQRGGSSGLANIMELGGNEGGDTYLTLFSRNGINEKIKFVADGNSFIVGNLGIGTTHTDDPNYHLFVEKGIRTRKVRVDQTGWPDYVFHSSYRLPSLQEVEKYITTHKHLPGVASAQEVEANGLDVGENQAALLKKIEELTLYVIDQNKMLRKLQNDNESLQRAVKALERAPVKKRR